MLTSGNGKGKKRWTKVGRKKIKPIWVFQKKDKSRKKAQPQQDRGGGREQQAEGRKQRKEWARRVCAYNAAKVRKARDIRRQPTQQLNKNGEHLEKTAPLKSGIRNAKETQEKEKKNEIRAPHGTKRPCTKCGTRKHQIPGENQR